MKPKESILKLARKRGMIRARDVHALGIARENLPRMAAAGQLNRVCRGLYALPGIEASEFHSYAETAAAVPRGVICLFSALRFHGLSTQSVPDVWVAVSGPHWRPKNTPFPVRYVHMSSASFREGVESHVIDGVRVPVFCPAKTVADCFKYRNKIGVDVALEALRDYLRRHRGGVDELWRYARICRITRILGPYLDTLL